MNSVPCLLMRLHVRGVLGTVLTVACCAWGSRGLFALATDSRSGATTMSAAVASSSSVSLPGQRFSVGDRVFASHDEEGVLRWSEARVVAVAPTTSSGSGADCTYLLHYLGHSSQVDEWRPFHDESELMPANERGIAMFEAAKQLKREHDSNDAASTASRERPTHSKGSPQRRRPSTDEHADEHAHHRRCSDMSGDAHDMEVDNGIDSLVRASSTSVASSSVCPVPTQSARFSDSEPSGVSIYPARAFACRWGCGATFSTRQGVSSHARASRACHCGNRTSTSRRRTRTSRTTQTTSN